MKKFVGLLLLLLPVVAFTPREYSYKLALLKYNGGGDWYANPSALRNLARFANENLQSSINPDYTTVEPASPNIFNYPYIHMTGHGNVVFSAEERKNLKLYLEAGGFLHIDDNYGMDPFIRKELKKLFPENELEPLPTSHPVFHQKYDFPKGIPKIHKHDQKPPVAYGIRLEGRLAVLYTHESDLGDGWEDAEVHNDPRKVRQKALRMGSNILQYVLGGE